MRSGMLEEVRQVKSSPWWKSTRRRVSHVHRVYMKVPRVRQLLAFVYSPLIHPVDEIRALKPIES